MTRTGYQCAACNRVCCWECDAPDEQIDEIKTIGGRFCFDCTEAEMAAHGLPRERIEDMRNRRRDRSGSCVHGEAN